ncbi:unnamed protein product [marine sediment metagenome]|uniref:HTH luxR-type domain-containing protein n=1 Tax=marine sediment metagenome TaxID=412755 RepID=X1CS17_9ZZZZ
MQRKFIATLLFADLNHREIDIILLIVQGKKIKDISETLFLSPKTISTYKCRIYEKLDINSDIELVRLFHRLSSQ